MWTVGDFDIYIYIYNTFIDSGPAAKRGAPSFDVTCLNS